VKFIFVVYKLTKNKFLWVENWQSLSISQERFTHLSLDVCRYRTVVGND
jgi:hypothetical protein